ncbi:hypothetical protein J2Z40_001312 [Cytobacillus eiseniae]|uniref:Uncharacterized protein n=1 Tax=Cytobacillus eiseniae TaxID=762947 RepID=A0ABS4RCZ2_9BACI|nr:hypothetical protein [Cytobacillus eiseniae]
MLTPDKHKTSLLKGVLFLSKRLDLYPRGVGAAAERKQNISYDLVPDNGARFFLSYIRRTSIQFTNNQSLQEDRNEKKNVPERRRKSFS